jgi:hypothetical protein
MRPTIPRQRDLLGIWAHPRTQRPFERPRNGEHLANSGEECANIRGNIAL